MNTQLTTKTLTYHQCRHAKGGEPGDLALITIGSAFRGDQGIAPALCNVLSDRMLVGVCRFDLGSHIGFLPDCLANHKAAIIVDSTINGTRPGTVSILDLGTVLDQNTPINITSSHGLSIVEELRSARKNRNLPKRIIFFGVEVGQIASSNGLSRDLQRKLPGLVDSLSLLVAKALETLKRQPLTKIG